MAPARIVIAGLALGFVALTFAGCGNDADPRPDKSPTKGDVVEVPGVQFTGTAAALSPDGSRIAVPCESRLCIWSTDTHELIAEPDGGNVVAWTPDGAQLVTSKGTQVVVLDASTGAEVRTLDGHTTPDTDDEAGLDIWDVDVAPDGTIASAGADGTVRLWGKDGTPGAVLEPGTEWPTDVAFSPDGKQLAISNVDAPLEIWNVAKAATVTELNAGPQGPVTWSPDGSLLATATAKPGGKAQVSIWDAATFTLDDQLAIGATSVDFSPDGKQLALTESSNSDLILWTIGAGDLRRISGTLEVLDSALWTADGRTIYTAGIKDGVRAWDVTAGTASDPFALPKAD